MDLSAISPRRAVGEPGADSARADQPPEPADWRAEAGRLRAALEDVVAMAAANAEARQRVVQMQRRAVAALNGADAIAPRRR